MWVVIMEGDSTGLGRKNSRGCLALFRIKNTWYFNIIILQSSDVMLKLLLSVKMAFVGTKMVLQYYISLFEKTKPRE